LRISMRDRNDVSDAMATALITSLSVTSPSSIPFVMIASLRMLWLLMTLIASRMGASLLMQISGEDVMSAILSWFESLPGATTLSMMSRSVMIPQGLPSRITTTLPMFFSTMTLAASFARALESIVTTGLDIMSETREGNNWLSVKSDFTSDRVVGPRSR